MLRLFTVFKVPTVFRVSRVQGTGSLLGRFRGKAVQNKGNNHKIRATWVPKRRKSDTEKKE